LGSQEHGLSVIKRQIRHRIFVNGEE